MSASTQSKVLKQILKKSWAVDWRARLGMPYVARLGDKRLPGARGKL
jgi:hypothetical protein